MYWALPPSKATFQSCVFFFDETQTLFRDQSSQDKFLFQMAGDLSHAPFDILHYDPQTGRLFAALRVGTLPAGQQTRGRLFVGQSGNVNPAATWEGFEAVWLGNNGQNRAGNTKLDLTSEQIGQGAVWPFGGLFDGAQSKLWSSSDGFFDAWSELTIEVLIKADEVGTDRQIIAAGPDGAGDRDHSFLLRYDAEGFRGGQNNVITISLGTADGALRYESAGGNQRTDAQHILFCWKIGERPRLYVDGIEDQPSWWGLVDNGEGQAANGAISAGKGSFNIGGGTKDPWLGEIAFVSLRKSFSSSVRAKWDGRNRLTPQSVYGTSLALDSIDFSRPIVAVPVYAKQAINQANLYDVISSAWDLADADVKIFAGNATLPGAIATATDNNLRYEAGNTSGIERISFILQNAEGHTSSSTLQLEVGDFKEGGFEADSPPPPPIGEPNEDDDIAPIVDRSHELPKPSTTIEVKSEAELQSQLNNANPGTHLLLIGGVYTKKLKITNKGTKDKPIVIRSKQRLGANLRGGFEFGKASKHVILYDIDLTDTKNILAGESNIIRRCLILPPFKHDGTSIGISCRKGKNCRIDYSTVRMYRDDETPNKKGWGKKTHYSAIRGAKANNTMVGLVIHRCMFIGGPTRDDYSAPNGGFCTTAENVTESSVETGWVLRKCVVRDAPTKHVIFEAKSSSNVFEYLDIETSSTKAYVSARQGHDNQFRGLTLNKCNIRVFRGPNHRIIGCDLKGGSEVHIMAGKATHKDMSNSAPQAFQAFVADVDGSGKIIVGKQFDGYDEPALKTTIEGIDSSRIVKHHEQDTQIKASSNAGNNTPKPWKGNPQEVGIDAPWKGEIN